MIFFLPFFVNRRWTIISATKIFQSCAGTRRPSCYHRGQNHRHLKNTCASRLSTAAGCVTTLFISASGNPATRMVCACAGRINACVTVSTRNRFQNCHTNPDCTDTDTVLHTGLCATSKGRVSNITLVEL